MCRPQHQYKETIMSNDTNTPATETSTSGPAPKRVRASKKAAKPAAKRTPKSAATKVRVAKPASKKAARPKTEPRTDTKKVIVLDLLRRKQGATTAEIAKATDWQNHSIRGFISGSVTKKMG
jgi:hypothetical protein